MRKRAFLAAILLALGFLLPCASTAEADTPVLRVGYTDVPGYISKGKDGYFRGFLYDYLEAIAVYGGYRFEYVEAQPTQCVEKLRLGEIDLIAALPDTYDAQPDLVTAKHSITYSPIGVTIRPDKTLAAGQKLRIGYTSFICSEQDIRSALLSHGLHENQDFVLVPAERFFQIITMYKNGEIDAFIDAAVYHGTESPMNAYLFTKPFSIATREDRA